MPNLFQAPPQNPILLQQAQDPRTALAQSLIAAASNARPVNSPWEGVARLGSGLAGALIARNAGREYKERGENYNKTLAEALQASSSAVPWTNPDTGMEAPGTSGGDRLAQALLANRDTAPLAMNIQAGEMERRQSSADRRNDARFAQNLRIEGIPLEDAAKLPGALAQARGVGGVNNELALALEGKLGPLKTAEALRLEEGKIPLGARAAGANAAAEQPYQLARIGAQAAATAANQPPRGPAGPMGGTGFDAQTENVLLRGDPLSTDYAAAYNRTAQPKVTFDPDTGKQIIIRPDMSAYRPPGGAPQAQGAQQAAPGTAAPPPIGRAPEAVPGAPGVTVQQIADPKVAFNEGQSNAAAFADRMAEADTLIGKTYEAGLSRGQRLRAGVPVVGNDLVSPEYQSFEQAKRNFINAQLRKESGAAIGKEEYESADKQYFPQPGDSAETVDQKAATRRSAIDGMRRSAGASYKPKPEENPYAGKTDAQIVEDLRNAGIIK